jgi:hypothetical protein
MPLARGLILTDGAMLGLFFIQRYRFLTIEQFARAADMHRDTASRQLRILELHGLLGHFGNIALPGYGRTPKVYFLTRKGWEILSRESDIPAELIGTHKETHVEARWSPQMYHRLRTVDLMIAAEVAVRAREHLTMVRTFIEYRRVKRGTLVARETTDYVANEETTENRIVPDAAFVMENVSSKKRALFFVEMDMATERIISRITREDRITLHYKIRQYDRYLKSLRYAKTYAAYGEFGFFTLLFVTLGDERVENIRREMHDLPTDLAGYYRFSTFDLASKDFLGAVWKSRSLSDNQRYPLVR